ncbi:MAG: neutral/alkaline non-lysosomal ceramidase N-terminal domain-containing protein [Verrucomicrobia bacterium]|nr:neutral/alkaline non-lysosomal ceramidase N-terminal domain-containing protein [Verrucomicrobiota bacterium]
MRWTTLSRCLTLACVFLAAAGSAQTASSSFKVGAGKRDITPKEPVPMWGYGARHDALSTGVLDPLLATALVLEAGTNKLAIVGLDLGRAPAEKSLQKVRERIRADAGIQHSFIAGSHTHHGPVLELTNEEGKGKGKFDAALRYYQELEDAIVASVLDANRKLAPAKMAAGSVQLDGFNRNRHTKIEPKPVDRELAVLRFDDSSGKPVALVVNFAAHPTMLPASTLKFSSDYIGSMRSAVEKELMAATIFMQGAAGDLSVNPGENKGPEAFGQALAREVIKLASGLSCKEIFEPRLEVREKRFQFAARTDLSNPLIRVFYANAFFPELVPNYADEYAEGVRPRLTVGLLNGEIALVGVSGEFFCQHSIRLKERARLKPVFFFGYGNGYHQYFPTIEAAAEGGYGADNAVAPAAVGAGEEIMNAALLWLYEMRGKLSAPPK